MPDRWALAAGRASSKGCNICHGPRLPGARLCAPCKAALKRARLETVSELIPRPPSAGALARAARRQERALAAAARYQTKTARAAEPSPPMWIIPAIIVAAAVLGGVAYLAQRTSPSATEDPKAASSAAPAAPSAEAQPAKAIEKINAAPPVDASVPAAPPHLAKPASAARLAPKRVVEAPPVPSAPVVNRFGSTTEPPAPAPAGAAEAMAPAREVPAPDRWQVMSDQINRCGRDGFFAGVICEQRVRLKYCEGYWGQAAQCPSGIPNDHGQ